MTGPAPIQTPLPAWLRSHLTDLGVLTETGLTRRAALRRCRACGAVVLAGIDRDGWDTHLDPDPLDPAGEAAALLDGRGTWWVWTRGRRELVRRDQWSIPARPAGIDPDRPVLAGHACTRTEETLMPPEPGRNGARSAEHPEAGT